jgi:hypothetical protein
VGRQAVVKVTDLVKGGVEVTSKECEMVSHYEWNEAWGEDQAVLVTKSLVVAMSPRGPITSYSTNEMVFDCRNADSPNHWIVQWLEGLQIPIRWI